jgi:hypothetical protein
MLTIIKQNFIYKIVQLMSRPEYQLPPHLYYNIDEANKYTNCSRIIHI